jgi:acyl dehydratase
MSTTLHREFTGITDAAVDALRSRIGLRIENTLEPWCYEATRDNIRHYAHGIGDDNPLWCDPGYAKGTRFGDVVAPPSFIFACNRIVSGYVGGLPGVHAMFAGCDFTWMKPIRRNAQISTEAWLKDLIEVDTRFAGRSIRQIYHVDFYDETGDQLASADSWCFRTDRDIAREAGTKYTARDRAGGRVYTQEELAAHAALYRDETIRGAAPRWFEEVSVGTALPRMAKGPMTITGFIAYVQGWGGLYITRPLESPTATTFQTVPNACTGTRTSHARWALPAPTTTVPSAAPGCHTPLPTGWVTMRIWCICIRRSAATIPRAICL